MTAHAEPVSAPLLHEDGMTSSEYAEAVSEVQGLRVADVDDEEDVERAYAIVAR